MMKPLLKRSISGLVYLAVLLGCILWCKFSFLALMLFMTGVMLYEFLRMTMGKEYRFSQTLTIITGLAFFAMVWAVRAIPAVTAEFILLAFVPLFAVMVNSLYVKDKTDFGKFANVYTALLYIAMPMSVTNFIVMDKMGHYSGMLLLAFFIIIWASDIGAYIFGMAFGQKYGKKLFPSISPKKSWIGFWGGFVLALLVSVLLFITGFWQYAGLDDMTWWHALLLGAVMNVAGVYGDLFESQWKRHYEVKDSGTIIPGHGGMMDRLDSAIFAIPVGMLYLSLFQMITPL